MKKNFTINDRKFTLLGEITTPQQFDYAHVAMRKYIQTYQAAVDSGIESSVMAFEDSNQLLDFLAAILVPAIQEKWTLEGYKTTRKFFESRLPPFDVIGEVVENFFTLNQKWAKFSPTLQKVRQKAMSMIIERGLNESVDYKKLMNEVSNSVNI